MNIFFDMDGTIADLYGVEGWESMLRAFDPTPYKFAKPLVNLSALARVINRLQNQGHEVSILSWLSKARDFDYDMRVTSAKMAWLRRHLPSVAWDHIYILPYGSPKSAYGSPSAILFDDEPYNRKTWPGIAYDENHIMEVLRGL